MNKSKIAGGLWGLLVGDALGVPYEFNPPFRLPEFSNIEMRPPANFSRSHRGVAPGTYSDDGAQALCLLDSLFENNCLKVEDFASRLVRWRTTGYLAVDGVVFDVGTHTDMVLHAIAEGVPPLQAGMRDLSSKGNGSLMRVLPLTLWAHQRLTDLDLVGLACLQSQVTHGAIACQLCCALYCLWARYILHGVPDAWTVAKVNLADILDSPELLAELDDLFHELDHAPSGSSYVVDCLRSARYAVETSSSYEETVRKGILLGYDTDTTACVAGGIAGILYGVEGIPQRWIDAMQGPFPTTSPQGDGKLPKDMPSTTGSSFPFPTTSPQGDGKFFALILTRFAPPR